MITKIGERDRFGYDDAGRPVAAQLSSNTIAFGYNFCGRLKIAADAGFRDAHHLYTDGRASILILNPIAKSAEIWFGNWQRDEAAAYHVINASYVGIVDKEIEDIESAKRLLASGEPIPYRPGYLSTSPTGQPIAAPDISADQELNLRLKKVPIRFFGRHLKKGGLSEAEKRSAGNLEFLLGSACAYVYRFDAASKLNAYADTMGDYPFLTSTRPIPILQVHGGGGDGLVNPKYDGEIGGARRFARRNRACRYCRYSHRNRVGAGVGSDRASGASVARRNSDRSASSYSRRN